MSHDHSHHHHHHESVAQGALSVALALICAVMVGEIAFGAIAHSLALLTDAVHMFTDAGALALSLVAARLAARPAAGAMTYGLRRVEILSAQANGVTLLLLSVLILYTAVRRLANPPHVSGWPMLAVALAGIVVNVAATWVLGRGSEPRSLNLEGSYQHLLTDLYAFIGTAVAAVVILATGFDRADPLVSLLIALLMARAGVSLVVASGRVFLEAAPKGLAPETIGNAMAATEGVVEVHDLHVWEVTSGFPALSAHVLVAESADCHAACRRLQELLAARFQIQHTTLQVEHEHGDDLLQIEVTPK